MMRWSASAMLSQEQVRRLAEHDERAALDRGAEFLGLRPV
jgi:hypothetical protein